MTSPFRVGRWTVEPAAHQVHGPAGTVSVEPKVMAVLCCLAEHAGEVVHRDVLLETVWADTCVVEETLTRCVSELRKVFDDDARRPVVIETIRKGGYRLMKPVRPVSDEAAKPASPRPADPHAPAPRRAVLERTQKHGVGYAVAGFVLLLVGLGVGLARVAPPPEPSMKLPPVQPLRPQPVTSTLGHEFDARLSPDGGYVAYAWAGPSGDNIDLYVKLIGQESALRLTHAAAADYSPAWSPDGHHLAFMRRDGDGCGLFIVPAIGGTEAAVGRCDRNYFGDLTWSPDGRWLAFSEQAASSEAHQIVLFDPETREKRVLTRPVGTPHGDYAPAFSPDGAYVVFVRMMREEYHDLFAVAVAGGQPVHRLTFDASVLRGHTWTPEGNALVVASTRRGRSGLWHLPFDTTAAAALTWIPTEMGDVFAPSMARGSGQLLFAQDRSDTNLWYLDLTGNEAPVLFAPSTRNEYAPHLTADGERVVFVSDRSGHPELWIAQRNGTGLAQATRFEGPLVDAPRWSPDGTRIAFNARPEGHVDVHVLDVATGAVRRLTHEAGDENVPRWSHDGQWLYFASDRGGARNVWRMAATGGVPTQVTMQGGHVLEEAMERGTYYVARNDTSGLWKIEPESTPTVVVEDLHETDWGNWLATEHGVFFLRRDSSRATLAFFDEQNRTSQTAAVLSQAPASTWSIPWSQPSVTLSADGAHLVFSRADRQESDLWMVQMPDVIAPVPSIAARHSP